MSFKKHKVTFFPVGNAIGNADTCRIDLEGGEKLLFDYNHRRNPNDPNEKRIDLAGVLKSDLMTARHLMGRRLFFDVVAFTHLDDDHIHGSSDFFYFLHSKEHQSDARIEIKTLWVPAAVITDEECDGEDALIQEEARYRLRQARYESSENARIRVFSRPEMLNDWLAKEKIPLRDVQHVITDAGRLVPHWTLNEQGVEFFIHSPFGKREDGVRVVDRNNDALYLQATFLAGGAETRLILSADVDSDIIEDIVRVTKWHKNESRLSWDINNTPHHSSYKSLNKEDKGVTETKPTDEVAWLYEQGNRGGYLVSTSRSVPTDPNDDQPPHRQSVAYYKKRAAAISGEFKITMEYPSTVKPDEMIFEITGAGATLLKRSSVGADSVTNTVAPRAGLG